MSFVLNAVYTFTFANSIFILSSNNPGAGFNPSNIGFSFERTLCGIICLIMTLRFFFGNNQYIADVMADNDRGAWQKFYQFSFIALQSVILLITSYLIRDTRVFVLSMTILFIVETVWYIVTVFVDRDGILNKKKQFDWSFFYAQLTNAAYWIGSLILLKTIPNNDIFLIILIFVIFFFNTVWDAKKNMAYYMGSG